MARKKRPKKPVTHTHPKATHRTCPKCGTPTIQGYDGHICAQHQILDAAPINEHEELGELKAGRITFYLDRTSKITPRHLNTDQHGTWILKRAAWLTVHKQHRCPPRPQQQNLF